MEVEAANEPDGCDKDIAFVPEAKAGDVCRGDETLEFDVEGGAVGVEDNTFDLEVVSADDVWVEDADIADIEPEAAVEDGTCDKGCVTAAPREVPRPACPVPVFVAPAPTPRLPAAVAPCARSTEFEDRGKGEVNASGVCVALEISAAEDFASFPEDATEKGEGSFVEGALEEVSPLPASEDVGVDCSLVRPGGCEDLPSGGCDEDAGPVPDEVACASALGGLDGADASRLAVEVGPLITLPVPLPTPNPAPVLWPPSASPSCRWPASFGSDDCEAILTCD